MKKIIIGFMMFLSVSFCFAIGQSFEVGVGYHRMSGGIRNLYTKNYNSANEREDIPVKYNTTIPSFAINLSSITYFTDNFGFGFYGNLLILRRLEMKAGGTTKMTDNLGFSLSMDLLLGPAFMVYNSKRLSVSLAAGFHWNILLLSKLSQLEENDEGSATNQIGLGANVTAGFNFTKNFYVYGRFQLTYDLYVWESIGGSSGGGSLSTGSSSITVGGSGKEAKKYSGKISALGILPCIGLGLKF